MPDDLVEIRHKFMVPTLWGVKTEAFRSDFCIKSIHGFLGTCNVGPTVDSVQLVYNYNFTRFKVVGGPTLWLTYSATHLGEPDSTKNKDGITKNGPLNFRPDRFSTQVFEVVFCLMPFSIFFSFLRFSRLFLSKESPFGHRVSEHQSIGLFETT